MCHSAKKLRKFQEEKLDKVSPSFCLAKWYEGTIWLYQGATASCHHNPTTKIDLDKDDLSSLHNTKVKIEDRAMMLNGEQPNGCGYCWNAEKFGQLSDRIYKSYSYNDNLIISDIPKKVTPIRLEVAFSRVCNMACAYCGPEFSSAWAKDIKVHGSYNLITNSKYNGDIKTKIIDEDDNEYIAAFFEWWPELSKTLEIMRITGGEPLLHNKFWEFIEIIKQTKNFTGHFIVNTNLILQKGQVERFIENTKFLSDNNSVSIMTSCESSLDDAEFTRDGFDKDVWLKNVHLILNTSKIHMTLSAAVNNISVWTYKEYLKLVNELRAEYGSERITLNANRVYEPKFLQIQIIPEELRNEIADEIETTVSTLEHIRTADLGLSQINGLTDFLRSAEGSFDGPHDSADQKKLIMNDLIKFYDSYMQKRNKSDVYLDSRFKKWIKGLRNG